MKCLPCYQSFGQFNYCAWFTRLLFESLSCSLMLYSSTEVGSDGASWQFSCSCGKLIFHKEAPGSLFLLLGITSLKVCCKLTFSAIKKCVRTLEAMQSGIKKRKKHLDFHLQMHIWYVPENSKVGCWQIQSVNLISFLYSLYTEV